MIARAWLYRARDARSEAPGNSPAGILWRTNSSAMAQNGFEVLAEEQIFHRWGRMVEEMKNSEY
eukprot:764046-Hanusia_phi.AAC.11